MKPVTFELQGMTNVKNTLYKHTVLKNNNNSENGEKNVAFSLAFNQQPLFKQPKLLLHSLFFHCVAHN